MAWDQLPAQIKILIKQNYQHNVVPEGENQPTHPVHTHLCLPRWLCPTPEGHALGLCSRHPS